MASGLERYKDSRPPGTSQSETPLRSSVGKNLIDSPKETLTDYEGDTKMSGVNALKATERNRKAEKKNTCPVAISTRI